MSKFPASFASIAAEPCSDPALVLCTAFPSLLRAAYTQRLASAAFTALVGAVGPARTQLIAQWATAAAAIHSHLNRARDLLTALHTALQQSSSGGGGGAAALAPASVSRVQSYLSGVMELYKLGVRCNRSAQHFRLPTTAHLRGLHLTWNEIHTLLTLQPTLKTCFDAQVCLRWVALSCVVLCCVVL